MPWRRSEWPKGGCIWQHLYLEETILFKCQRYMYHISYILRILDWITNVLMSLKYPYFNILVLITCLLSVNAKLGLIFHSTPPSGKRVQNWPVRTSLEFSSLWPYVKRPALSIWHSSSRSPYKNLEVRRNSMKLCLFPDYITWGCRHILHFKNIFENKKFSINSNQLERLLRPYQHYVMGR